MFISSTLNFGGKGVQTRGIWFWRRRLFCKHRYHCFCPSLPSLRGGACAPQRAAEAQPRLQGSPMEYQLNKATYDSNRNNDTTNDSNQTYYNKNNHNNDNTTYLSPPTEQETPGPDPRH